MSIIFTLMLAATPFEDGSAALLKGDWQSAVDSFTESIEEKPTAKAYVNRGIAYSRLEKFAEAFDDYSAAIKLDPKEPLAYANRGNVYERTGEPDKAIADYTKALELKPTASVYAMRGSVRHKRKEYAKARDDYREALKLNENELNALNNLAWLEATCPDAEYRNGKAAVERARRACELTQWRVKPYVSTLAAAFAENGEWEKAVRIAQSDERIRMFSARKPVRD